MSARSMRGALGPVTLSLVAGAAICLSASVVLSADWPRIDTALINNGIDPIEPGQGLEKSVDLRIEASHNVSHTLVARVDCMITGPQGFQLFDAVFLERSGSIDDDTALFDGHFVMDFWYPAGVYSVEALAWENGQIPGPLYTTSFNYAEGGYVGTPDEGPISFDYYGPEEDGLPGFTAFGTVRNEGNIPIRVWMSICEFAIEGGEGTTFYGNPKGKAPDGSWMALGDTPSEWGNVDVQGSESIELDLTIPEGLPSGTYTSTLTLTTVDSLEGSSSNVYFAGSLPNLAYAAAGNTLQIPLTITVPESATLSLLALGGLALIRRRTGRA